MVKNGFIRSCTLYYNFTSASKTLEMPFQCTKILQVSGGIPPDLPNLESVSPPPTFWDGLTPLNAMALALPKLSVPLFGGNAMEYCDFIRAFENIIEANRKSSSASLYYLIQYTTGEVQELMRIAVRRWILKEVISKQKNF